MKVEGVLTGKEERVTGSEHWTGEVAGEPDNKCSTDYKNHMCCSWSDM